MGTTVFILVALLYFWFCCACMQAYLHGVAKDMTVKKSIFIWVISVVLSIIYVPILLGIKVGELLSRV